MNKLMTKDNKKKSRPQANVAGLTLKNRELHLKIREIKAQFAEYKAKCQQRILAYQKKINKYETDSILPLSYEDEARMIAAAEKEAKKRTYEKP